MSLLQSRVTQITIASLVNVWSPEPTHDVDTAVSVSDGYSLIPYKYATTAETSAFVVGSTSVKHTFLKIVQQ